jgi:hypothetical protein
LLVCCCSQPWVVRERERVRGSRIGEVVVAEMSTDLVWFNNNNNIYNAVCADMEMYALLSE